jgi:hypothetical protein
MISKKRSVRRIARRESAMLARNRFLSGMLTRGEVVFAGSKTEAAHDREPVAISTGEVLPHYAGGAKGRLRVELRCSRTTGAALIWRST